MGTWKLRYFLTDDSAAEQRAVAIAFPGLTAGEQEVDHFLCRKHSERTMDRKLAGARNKAAKGHLYQALYFRHSAIGCEQSVEAAIHAAPEDKKEYIRREWWSTRHQWAYYTRQHSCLLLQCMTINAVESWHKSLKHHAEGKEAMSKFSLRGAAEHILSIGDQWKLRATKAATIFRTTRTAECIKYPDLGLFPGPVQILTVA